MPTPAVIRGALTALYAGPTDYDRPAGLTVESSGSSGFASPGVRYGSARVRLTGGCDSSGATFTVAREVMPTLKQFASVDVVKIYDPDGHTEHPRGRSDSIPTCLEPRGLEKAEPVDPGRRVVLHLTHWSPEYSYG